MTQYHEPVNELSNKTRDITRALVSLKEEIEAIDWYNQRIDCTEDKELSLILSHNRDEEIEHACMTIEWLRREMDGWDKNLKAFLFSEESIAGDDTNDTGKADGNELEDLGIRKVNK